MLAVSICFSSFPSSGFVVAEFVSLPESVLFLNRNRPRSPVYIRGVLAVFLACLTALAQL